MVKYIIKKHCEATTMCTVALNRTQDYYYGNVSEFLSRDFQPVAETISIYGFDSRFDAEKRMQEMQNHLPMEAGKYWDITLEIIEVEV